jgi:phosphoribosyl 1,2-cyclic phosphodiesterase
MKLHIIGSSSKGNCYLLESDTGQTLMIECGTHFDKVKRAMKFRLSGIVGCILTHEHMDHAKAIHDVMDAGIDVWTAIGTHSALDTLSEHRAKAFTSQSLMLGEFRIKPFDVKHDAKDPLGFIINHPECGNVVFITDTYYVPYKFQGLNNIIIEANYSDEVLAERGNAAMQFLADRILQSHMSLETCKGVLRANDLSAVNNIVLIHLSDRNSNAERFKHEIAAMTGKSVHVAEDGMSIDFNETAF